MSKGPCLKCQTMLKNEMGTRDQKTRHQMHGLHIDREWNHGLSAISGEDLRKSCESCRQIMMSNVHDRERTSVTKFQGVSRDRLVLSAAVVQELGTTGRHNFDTLHLAMVNKKLQGIRILGYLTCCIRILATSSRGCLSWCL
jgi:hypothetical protein